MIIYKCDRCGYTNKLKTNFKRHLSRKLPCKPLLNDLNIIDIYNKYFKNDNKSCQENVKKCQENVKKSVVHNNDVNNTQQIFINDNIN